MSCRPSPFRAYSLQEETLVNEEPNKAGPGLVPPVYGLSVRAAALLPCVCVCVCVLCVRVCALWGKIEKGKVWCPALPTPSRSGSAASPALWSGSTLYLVHGGDKRWVKIRKSKLMGDKTNIMLAINTLVTKVWPHCHHLCQIFCIRKWQKWSI